MVDREFQLAAQLGCVVTTYQASCGSVEHGASTAQIRVFELRFFKAYVLSLPNRRKVFRLFRRRFDDPVMRLSGLRRFTGLRLLGRSRMFTRFRVFAWPALLGRFAMLSRSAML